MSTKKATLNLITTINNQINNQIQYKTDIELYKKPEFWNTFESISHGDCEDYALTKRKKLLDLDIDPNTFHLATCWTETNEYHAILIVSTTKGDYVLDNRYPFPMKKQDLKYKFHLIQKGNKWHTLS